jgi:DUF4097 and DUF4098 domain-containing protein YvlB
MKGKNSAIYIIIFSGLLVSLFLLPHHIDARDSQEVRKTFKGKTAIKLKTFNGDCVVKSTASDEISVRFVHTYSNTTFEPLFQESGSTLVLKEKFHIAESGNSTWYLTVPVGTVIKYSSISGDFSVDGLKADIDAVTVSGDIKAGNCSGKINFKTNNGDLDAENLSGKITIRGASSDLKVNNLSGNIDIKTASGDVEAEKLGGNVTLKSPSGDVQVKNSSGVFNVKTASGEIHATEILFKGVSHFKTASGDIYISLSKTLAHDLHMDTASGDVVLNYNGHSVEGYFQFKIHTNSGEIISPYPFEKEEEDQKWGKKYKIKSFSREYKIPKVYMSTTSGTLELKEK